MKHIYTKPVVCFQEIAKNDVLTGSGDNLFNWAWGADVNGGTGYEIEK